VDFDKLDYEEDITLIIGKVVNHGLWEDFLEIIRFYGESACKKELVKLTKFTKKTFEFVSLVFNIQRQEFKNYTGEIEPHKYPPPMIISFGNT
jgi:hypothetical protein